MDLQKFVFVIISCALFPWVLSDRDKVQFAENLLECTKTTPINDCLRTTLEDLRSFMRIGIPELELMPSEPFFIDSLHFKTQPQLVLGAVQVESTFRSVS